MANRSQPRDRVTGRFAKVDPERDLVPENVSAEGVCAVADNALNSPPVPRVTDEPEAEPARSRIRTQATGLRGAYSRTDQHLVEKAQDGTSLLPGTQTGDIPTGDKVGTP